MPTYAIDSVRENRPRLKTACSLSLMLFLLWAGESWAQVKSSDLQPAETRSEQVGSTEVARYHIHLEAGQAVELSVQQLAGTVKLTWADRSKDEHPPIQTDAGRFARLDLTLAADFPDDWQIELASRQADAGAEYRLELGLVHSRTEVDADRAAAELALAAAEAVRVSGKHEVPEETLTRYQAAATGWQAAQDPCGMQIAEIGKARFQLDLARYTDAQTSAQQALDANCVLADQQATLAQQAHALRVLSSAIAYQGDYAAAIEWGDKSLTIYRQTGDSVSQGWLLGNLGADYRKMGEMGKAMQDAQEAVTIARNVGNLKGAVFAQEAVASIQLARGELAPALDSYRQTIVELHTTPYPMVEGMAWSDLGVLYGLLGDGDSSQHAYQQAESVWAASGNTYRIASTLWNKGFVLLAEGNLPQAKDAFQRALDISLSNHYQSEQAHALEGLGRCALATADWKTARARFEDSLNLAQQTQGISTEIYAYLALGDLESGLRRFSAARLQYEKARQLAYQTGDLISEPVALGNLARVFLKLDRPEQSRPLIEQALAIVESQRGQLNDSRLRGSYFASQRAYYELYIEILMQLERRHPGRGYANSAFEASERARARILQDLLSERSLFIDRDLDAAALMEERSAEDHLHAAAYQIAQLPADARAELRAGLQGQVDDASRRLDDVRARIRRANPRYAELAHPEKLSLREVQSQLLDPHTALIEYWLGDRQSYAWLVTTGAVHSFILPPRQHIEDLANRLRNKLSVGNVAFVNVPIESLPDLETSNFESVRALGRELGEQLLGPLGRRLKDKSVVVVADGELERIPFDILESAQGNKGTAMTAGHDFVYLPSIESVRWLRDNRVSVARTPTMAIMADPVFTADDPRLGTRPDQSPKPTIVQADAPVSRAADDVGLADLPRLRYSRDEAQAIAGLLPHGSAWVALDFEASRQSVLQAEWQDYSVVHFATHALLDLRHPELSGIVLSLYDASGHQQDGFLRMNDIYNLHIPADLVMLSACDSALGKSEGEEGVFSLSRAFFYAGTRRVLASLWPVDDRASAEFSTLFYKALLQDRRKPGDALRLAQDQMASDPHWRLPYYWAGYVLQGDWQ